MPTLAPLGFSLVKVLGQGGYGCACLFQMQDINGSFSQFPHAGSFQSALLIYTKFAWIYLLPLVEAIKEHRDLLAAPPPL